MAGVHYPEKYLAKVRTDTDVPTSLAFSHHHQAVPYFKAKMIVKDNILKRVADCHKKFHSNV